MTASVKLIALVALSFWIDTTLCQNNCFPKCNYGTVAVGFIIQEDTSTPSNVVKPGHISSCGYRNDNGLVAKNVETPHNVAKFGEFPWMVLISHPNGTYICGGSLIAPNVVLTTAHDVIDKIPEELSVRAGEWDRESDFEPYRHQNALVKEIICHEDFGRNTLNNDIALLILENSFTLMPNVQPICLPEINTKLDLINCVSSGWGQYKLRGIGADQQILGKVNISVVPHSMYETQMRINCNAFYSKLNHSSFTCAGGVRGNEERMRGSGSPLICPDYNDPKRYYQVGIVAWGSGGSAQNVPGLYSNVMYLRNFIIKKLEEKGVNL